MRKCIILSLVLLCHIALSQTEIKDSAMIAGIREEGLNHSQVMEIAFQLTDANGPRLMQSPGFIKAAHWAKDKLASWGLENARLEPFGHWGNSWQLEKYYFALTAPYYKPLMSFPKTFSKGTGGLKQAEVILLDIKDSTDLPAWSGKVKGKLVMMRRSDSLPLGYAPDALRYTDSELIRMAAFDPKAPVPPSRSVQSAVSAARLLAQVKKWAAEEGALGILTTSTRNSDGTVFVQNGIPYTAPKEQSLTDLSMSYEDFMALQRMQQHGIPVRVELELRSEIISDNTEGYNVVAEIPGTDKKLKDQLVIIGGHLDSWQGSTGATDNAAGSAVMMEVMRILRTVNFHPRRTIRICLWGGEETGLFGSKNYVRNHFTDTVTKKYNAEGDKVSVYLNLDNGTGKIRGIYLQGNASAGPVFEKWFLPFHDLGAKTTTLQYTGGTDILPFDSLRLPAFQFIQDPMEYGSRTHHSNVDSYDHLSPADLRQASTIIAGFVYFADAMDEKFPRK